MPSVHTLMMAYMHYKSLTINHEGHIRKISTTSRMNQWCIEILIAGSLYHIVQYIRNIRPIPLTLLATTHYASFIEQILILNRVPYLKIHTPFIQDTQYMTSSKKKCISMNPTLTDFNNQVIEMVQLDNRELTMLADRLTVDADQVYNAQMRVLHQLPDINAHHIVRHHYVDDADYQRHHYDIVKVTRIHATLYEIHTVTGSIYTNYIITDIHSPLTRGDIVNKLYFDMTEMKVLYDEKYVVNDLRQLESLRSKLNTENIVPLPFYNLKHPRTGLILHPFHWGTVSDILLMLMIITQVIIDQLYPPA